MHVRIALTALCLCSCFRNPATGKLNLDLMSESQEVSMGQEAKKQAEQSIGLYQDQKIQQYVADLGKTIAPVSGRNVPFSYEVVDDASVNAFALPGGPIFVTRGILGHLNSEAQLVAVMGHETGHVAARHSANQMSKAQIAQVGLGIGSIVSPTVASIGQLAAAGLQVLFLKYSRDDEDQADLLGFRYMTQVGYDPRQMLDLFKMLQGVTDQAGGGKLPEWTQTHPIPEHRLEKAQEHLKNVKGDLSTLKVEREKYLKTIDGIVFGENPRNGYFKGDLFVQPEMKFQIQFPAGWQHQNQPEAVVAVSKEQDAMLQLAVAGKLSPEDAAAALFKQQGIKQGPAAQLNVNGMHAVAAYFSAQTQAAAVEGLVAFVAKDGTTFALLGYTPAGGLQKRDATIKSWISSFNNVTDGSLLNVQPAKLKLVQLSAPMPVAEFVQKYPSSVKPETIALINGVDKGGTIPAGPAKSVVGGVEAK